MKNTDQHIQNNISGHSNNIEKKSNPVKNSAYNHGQGQVKSATDGRLRANRNNKNKKPD